MTQGTRPETAWATTERVWDVEGIFILLAPDHLLKIFATTTEAPNGELIYEHLTDRKRIYVTDRWPLIERALDTLKRHMVLDDLADA